MHDEAVPAPPRRSRRILFLLSGILAGLLLFVALLPRILSSPAGTRWVVKRIDRFVPGTVRIEDAKLRWGKGQSFAGIRYRDDDDGLDVSVATLDAPDISLLRLLLGKRDLGDLRIDKPEIELVRPAETSAQPAAAPPARRRAKPVPPEERPITLPPGLRMNLVVSDGSVAIRGPGEPTRIGPLETTLRMETPRKIVGETAAGVRRGNLSGRVRARFDIGGLFDDQGTLSIGAASGTIEIRADSLPSAALDSLLGRDGAFVALLGPDLAAEVLAEGKAGNILAEISLESRNCDLRVSPRIEAGGLSLAKRGALHLAISPEAWAIWLRNDADPPSAELLQPFEIKLGIDRLSVPRNEGGWAWQGTSVSAEGEVSEIRIRAPGSDGIVSIRGTRTSIETPQLRRRLLLSLEAEAGRAEADSAGRIALKAALENWLTAEGKLDPDEMTGTLVSSAEGFPLRFADSLLRTGGKLPALLGETLDLDLNAELESVTDDGDMSGSISLAARSDRLRAQVEARIAGRVLSSNGTNRLSLVVSPAALEALGAPRPPSGEGAAAVLGLRLDRFSIPLSRSGTLPLQIAATIDPAPMTLADAFAPKESFFSTLFGEKLAPIEVSIRSPSSPRNGFDLEIRTSSPSIEADLAAAVRPSAGITVKEGSSAAWTLDPEAFALLASREDGGSARSPQGKIGIEAPVRMEFAIRTLDSPWPAASGAETGGPPWWAPLKIDATMRSPLVVLRPPSGLRTILRDTVLRIRSDSPGERTVLSLASNLDQEIPGEGPGGILRASASAEADLYRPSAPDARIEARAAFRDPEAAPSDPPLFDLRRAVLPLNDPIGPGLEVEIAGGSIPIRWIDAFLSGDRRLASLLGPEIESIALTASREKPATLRFRASAKTARLSLDLDGDANEGRIRILGDSEASLALTPESWDEWVLGSAAREREDAFRLDSARPIVLSIRSLEAALTTDTAGAGSKRRIDPAKTRFDLRLEIPGASFLAGDDRVALNDVKIDLSSHSLADSVRLLVQGGIDGAAGAGEGAGTPGTIRSDTTVTGIFPPTPSEPRAIEVRTETMVRGFPTGLLDALLGTEGNFAGILGDRADFDAEGAIGSRRGGPMDLQVRGSRASVRIATADSPNLELREPAEADVEVSPEFSELVLKRVNPLLVHAVSSDTPIHMTVQPEGFSVPLDGGAISNAVADVQLDLGTLYLDSGGLLEALLDALDRETTDRVTARFTPMALHLERGILSYDEMWMVVENLAILFQGEVDLVRQQVNLDAALSGKSLTLAFRELRDIVDPDMVLRIPIRGSLHHPKLDTEALAAELARLGARAAIRRNLGGEEGDAAASLIDVLLGGESSGKPVPPPPILRPDLEESEGESQGDAEEKAVESPDQEESPGDEESVEPAPSKEEDPWVTILRGILEEPDSEPTDTEPADGE